MKLFKKILPFALAFTMIASATGTVLAEAPTGYTEATTTTYDGSIMGYDVSTGRYWLDDDGVYEGGEFDANRKYGKSAYIQPGAKADVEKLTLVNAHPDGMVASLKDTWPESWEYWGDDVTTPEDESICDNMLVYSYTTLLTMTTISNVTSYSPQSPELWYGTVNKYNQTNSAFSSDFATIVEFDMADPDKEYVFTAYVYGTDEDYRFMYFDHKLSTSSLPNGSITENRAASNTANQPSRPAYLCYNEWTALTAIAKGVDGDSGYSDFIPTAVFDLGDYQAEKGTYVSFKVKGSFTIVLGATTDYSSPRHLVYGTNLKVYGMFFDEVVEETEDNTVVNKVYTKLDSRKVSLDFDCTDSAHDIVVLRKLDGEDWIPITVLKRGITTYTDSDVDSDSTYYYGYATFKDGVYTAPKMITTAFDTDSDYSPVTMTLGLGSTTANTNKLVYVTEDSNLTISVNLKDDTSTAIANATVNLEVDGRYIDTYIDIPRASAITNSKGNATLTLPCSFVSLPHASGSTTTSGYSDYGYDTYTVTVTFEYDDIRKLAKVTDTFELIVKPLDTADVVTPTVSELSDSVGAGDLLNVSGENLWDTQNTQIYLSSTIYGDVYENIDADNLIATTVEQYDIYYGNYMNVRLPDDFARGTYYVWAVSGSVVSEASEDTILNRARIYWLDAEEAFEGLEVNISGINFLSSTFGEVGVASETIVRLTGSRGQEYYMPVVDLSNYLVTFEIDDIPVGQYDVQVSSDGGVTWSNIAHEQTFNIVQTSVDPLGLGVAWVNRFTWDRVFDVTDYGAVANDGEDDTIAIWCTIDACRAAGGGIVYLPEGVFEASDVEAFNGVVLLGAGQDKTRILYNGVGGNNMFHCSTSCTGTYGYANFSISMKDASKQPDQFFQIGDQWGTNSNTTNQNNRVCSYIFIKNISINASMTYVNYFNREGETGEYRGCGVVAIMDKCFLMEDCYCYGVNAQLFRAYINGYMEINRNHFEFARECVVVTASYSMCTYNDVIGHHEYYDRAVHDGATYGQQHGIFHRDRIFIAHNTLHDIGSVINDGEAICAEPINSSYAYGQILEVGTDEDYTNTVGDENYTGRRYMVLGNDNDIRDITYGVYGCLEMYITSGTGVGQRRYIDPTIALSDSQNGNRVYLMENEEDWDILPDSTSTFCLIHTIAYVTVYSNNIYDATKGILLYGNFYDSVVADNYMEETEGICVWSTENQGTNRFNPDYRMLVINNRCIGAGKTGASGIGCHYDFNSPIAPNNNTIHFHVEFRENYVVGDLSRFVSTTSGQPQMYNDMLANIIRRRLNALSEAPILDGFYVRVVPSSTPGYSTWLAQKEHNILFTNNTVKDTLNGIFIGEALINGLYVDNMTYIDVINEHGFDATQYSTESGGYPVSKTLLNIEYNSNCTSLTSIEVATAYVDVFKPIWSNGTANVLKVGSKYLLTWTAAQDNVGIDHYDVYLNGATTPVTSTATQMVVDKFTSATIYAVDAAGNTSSVGLTAGDKVVMGGMTSVGVITKGVSNSISYTSELNLYNDVSTVTYTLNYNKNVLTYVSSTLLVDGEMSVNADTKGKVVYTITINGDYAGDYTGLIETEFNVKTSALSVGGNTQFSLTGVSVKAGDTAYAVSLTNSGVRVLNVVDKVTSLDFNGDGKLSVADYNKAVAYFGSTEGDESWLNAAQFDINGDGIVDIEDIMLIYYSYKN